MARLDDHQRDTICDRYATGESSNALGREFGVSGVAVRKLLQKRGIDRRPDNSGRMLNDAQEITLCERYAGGETAATVAVENGVSPGYVGRLLTRHGYAKRSDSEARRRYRCDHTFFDEMDTERKAYWLGFVAADGCVVGRSGGGSSALQVILSSKDRDHLALLAAHLRSDHPVKDGTGRTPDGRPTPTCRLFIRSEQLARGLSRYGVVPAKTWTFRWPHLRDDLARHFLRGYFDGDGWWATGVNRKRAVSSPTACFNLLGNRAFLLGCQRHLMAACGLRRTALVAHRTSEIARLTYSGNTQGRRVFRHLYDDATVYLPRKRAVVATFI